MTALYIHIPFCLSKCPYCDFYSRVAGAGEIENYVAALCVDIQRSPLASPLASVFFGGGTPSLLSAMHVDRILAAVARAGGFTADVEVTLEVNPGTVTLDKLCGYRDAGVNRLSIGVQSFDDNQLKWLGRKHDSALAVQAVTFARQAGFQRINLDLMFSLPQQTLNDLSQQLQVLKQLAPEHVAVYGLTIEEDTPFAAQHGAGLWHMPDDELYRQMYMLVDEQLGAMGYEHYEISNYAQPGERCRHNLVYWQRQPYLGIGAGAHSFFSGTGWGERWACENSIAQYLQAIATGSCPRHHLESFTKEQAMSEAVYLALRCCDGIDLPQFAATFGQSFSAAYPVAISRCSPNLSTVAGRTRLDVADWLLYNHLIENFL